jgi:(p)ppGpp synthase/HD superfamily hydrolase
MPFLSGAENRDTFFRRVAKFLPELDPRYQAICKAYEIAKDAFREVERDGGERYFEHLRAVALILLEYLEIEDYEVIIAALLHDIVEDKPEWDIQRIRNEFGDRVALLVSYLSQPGPDEFCKEDSRCLTMLWSIFESGNE